MKKLILGLWLFYFLPIAHGQNQYLVSKDSITFLESTNLHTSPRINKGARNYMQSNLNYPELAIDYGIKGEVILLLSILQNGQVDTAEVLEGIGFGCDEEAIRLVLNMPIYSPATYEGIPVGSKIKMIVRFRLL